MHSKASPVLITSLCLGLCLGLVVFEAGIAQTTTTTEGEKSLIVEDAERVWGRHQGGRRKSRRLYDGEGGTGVGGHQGRHLCRRGMEPG